MNDILASTYKYKINLISKPLTVDVKGLLKGDSLIKLRLSEPQKCIVCFKSRFVRKSTWNF